MKKQIYYAHAIDIYDKPTELRDLELMNLLFGEEYEVFNPNSEYSEAMYALHGMDYFLGIVEKCDVLAFRGYPNGKIPAGVWKEIMHAAEHKTPIIELPCFSGRQMSVEDTRMFIREIGTR
jgi:hypothetical protein